MIKNYGHNMIKNKEIKQLNNKCLKFPKRIDNNLSKDFNNFINHMEKPGEQQKKIDYNQKLSEENIVDLMNRLQFNQLSKNIYSDSNSIITIKPLTSLFQVIRLYGHAKYIKSINNGLKTPDIEPENNENSFIKKVFNLFC